jgi:hypothetical protein
MRICFEMCVCTLLNANPVVERVGAYVLKGKENCVQERPTTVSIVMLLLERASLVTRPAEPHRTYGQRQCVPAAEVAALQFHAPSTGGAPHARFIWGSSSVRPPVVRIAPPRTIGGSRLA